MKAPKALIPLLVCTVLAWAPETLRVDSRAVAHTASAGATPASQVFQATSSDDFTLVLLPDTQFYSAQANGATLAMFTAQTQWVADNELSENIKAVIGLGDIVNCGNRTTEWQNASAAYAILDSAGVPYVPVLGNHDYDDAGCGGPIPNRTVTSYTIFFGPSRLSAYPWYGTSSFPVDSNENFYITFTAGSRHYLVLALEFFPRDSALAWAQGIVTANPDKEVIVTTHAYLYNDDTRATDTVANGPAEYGLVADNNGEEMWDKFIKNHANIIAVVNGHFQGDGLGRRVDAADNGNLVAQMLSNYQMRPDGGGGFLRILTFRPSLGIIEASTFSPFLNQFKTDPDNEFAIPYQGIVTPRIDSVQPPQGPIAGGTTVTLKGAHLSGAILKVNKTAVTPLSQTDTEIRFTTPLQDNGIALITLRSAAGAGYGEFLYLPPRLDEIPPGHITTIAGVGRFWGDGRPATKAMVEPTDVALDSSGNIYIAEPGQTRIRRIRTDGIIEPFAGSEPGFSGDGGPAIDARLGGVRGLAVDTTGSVYIPDWSHRIRRVDPLTGIITTIAGTGVAGFSGDGGSPLQAQINLPTRITVDRGGNVFILDWGNARIRWITSEGTISTLAGTGTPGFSGDGGPAMQAQINPNLVDDGGLAVDLAGNVYLADSGNSRIRKVDRQTGIINTVVHGTSNGRAITVDPAGNIYFAPGGPSTVIGTPSEARIIRMTPAGEITAIWGKGTGFAQDGTPARDAPLGFIDCLAIDSDGNILFCESSSSRLRRINVRTGLLETAAGIGPALIGETGPAVTTVLNNTNSDLALSSGGDLLIADSANSRLRKIDARGNISTIAGNGFLGLEDRDEVPALETQLPAPIALEVERDASILLADTAVIRRIDSSGIIHRAACKQAHGFSGDGGPATEASCTQPWDVVTDAEGNLYIADANNNRIRRVDARSGIVTTIAGSGPSNGVEGYGKGTFCGDGGPALQACFNTPYGVAADKHGNLFIADSLNHRIRMVDRGGTVSTFTQTFASKLVFDRAGNLYAVTGDTVIRISPDGAVTRVAGGNGFSFSGDGGPAAEARLSAGGQAAGIAFDSQANLYFTDGDNRRIRAVRFGAIVAPRDGRIDATAGTPQQTTAGNLFPLELVASVRDAASNPAVGTQVTFTAPAGGPTCTQTTFTALTDRFGHASVTCRASNLAGSFSVTATALGLAQTATFQLANFAPDSSPTPIPAGSAVTTFIPHIISGQGFVTRLTLVNLTGNTNNIRIHFLTPNGAVESTFSRTLTAAGASAEISTGESKRFTQPQTRWAAIGSDSPVGVTVFFELKHAPDALPVTGVGFSAPRLLRQLVLPVRFEPATPQPFTVGIALANPTGQSNPISVTLRDAQGNAVAQDSSLTLPAFGQTAFLFTDLPGLKPFLAGQPSFKGSVAIAAGQLLSAIGVGDDFGPFFAIEPFEASACLPLFCTATTSAIPHIVAGDGLRTVITLVNLSSGSNSVTLQRFNQDGTPGQAVSLTLPPNGRAEIDTGEDARFGPAITQWATLQASAPVGVNVFFDLKHPAARGEVVTAVGFSNLQPSATFTLPAAFARPAAVLGQTEPLTVGLALANAANDFSRVTLRLLDENGALVAEDSSTQLAPKGQVAFVVSELPELKRFLQNRPPFRGLLSISATGPLAPLAVGDDFGPFFALPVLAALSH